MITNRDCRTMVQCTLEFRDQYDLPNPPRLAAYLAAFNRACEQSGGPYDSATPRLMCLASRLAGLLT
jgi:hypothetical protein